MYNTCWLHVLLNKDGLRVKRAEQGPRGLAMGEKSYPPTCAGFTEVILMGLMVVVYSVIGGMKINLTGEGQSRRKEVFS